MKVIIIALLLLTLGCIQPNQFTKDCSIYRDISLISNCYKEQAYYKAAIGDTSEAIGLCKSMYNAIQKADRPGFQDVMLSFDKTMADLSRFMFMLDNYNNCILNVARLARDESICSNIKSPKDLIAVIPALSEVIDNLIPTALLSEEMCRIEVKVTKIRDGAIKPFEDYIK